MTRLKNSILFWYLLSRLITRASPLISIGFIYGFLEESHSTTQMNGMFTLGVLIVFYTFYSDLKNYAKKFFDNKWKDLTEESKWLIVVGLILAFIQWAKMGLGNLETLFIVIFISQLIALYPSVMYEKLLRIKSEKQKEKSQT